MSEQVLESTPVVEQTPLPESEPEPLSVAEHAALYGTKTEDARPEVKESAEAKAAHHSEQQKRDRETQQFREGKTRHRAQSQQASPADVPRIQALTAKLRAAEDELTRLRSQAAPPAQIAKAEQVVERAEAKVEPVRDASDPEPSEDDPKYAGDYGKYLRDAARWDARQERRQAEAESMRRAEQAKIHEAQQRTITTFGERVKAAKAVYSDFEQVAFTPSPIPIGSPVDAFIMEDDNGAHVLYHLHSHPDELSDVLGMGPLKQLRHLSLLSQRFDTPVKADATGAAARGSQFVPPPRPPTPVRTEAQRVSSPPPTDGSLSVAEHRKLFGPKSR